MIVHKNGRHVEVDLASSEVAEVLSLVGDMDGGKEVRFEAMSNDNEWCEFLLYVREQNKAVRDISIVDVDSNTLGGIFDFTQQTKQKIYDFSRQD